MTLAIFDLDNTLIAGDSDYLWGQFLVERGIVDRRHYEQANERFYDDYRDGRLDIDAFLQFALKPLSENDAEQLHQWRQDFIEECIRPILLPAARELLDIHRKLGHTLMVITATNRFVTEPIAGLYGVDELIATVPEFEEGRYTGRYLGVPCFQSGKVTRLQAWLHEHQRTLRDSWFYSDSHNDRPLLECVTNAVAVDPDVHLKALAEQRGWPLLSLRSGRCLEDHKDRLSHL